MSNCIIAQSGGPTSVINSSVVGLIEANKEFKAFDNVYGGLNGIEGILAKNIVNLSDVPQDQLDLFKYTPSSGLGSCRYKLKDHTQSPEEYEKLMTILKELDITAFFYVGGNDSMDTTNKLTAYGKEFGIDIKFIGIPKTIDNDLMCTDHTPGFGSAGKFIATTTLETFYDSSVYINNGIFILETMGRDTGWLAASAALAQKNGKPVADFIYLPEKTFSLYKFLEDVKKKFEENNKVYIVASEGLVNENGEFLSLINGIKSLDRFGHAQLGGVGNYLRAQIIKAGITDRVKALELGVLQRCSMHSASQTDIDEAYQVGYDALRYSLENESGFMVAIKRETNFPYTYSTFTVPTTEIANKVKYFPKEWINDAGNHITEEAIEYLRPLIAGDPNFTLENFLPKFKVFNQR
ncbi:6-phosphofructokinase [Clostridium paridis]|uniref:Pyrophosphate--fructose 6-phosphate 1-phosphotransferase n=1 Tax=Clostridium paridis TaxID=2803863 RepID=A0A937K500_9CLOT|nr:6-phosphofructokinase [Clostridium paridis]MBL4932444.1 6-phosphofructokinase [Clostridium paridis]